MAKSQKLEPEGVKKAKVPRAHLALWANLQRRTGSAVPSLRTLRKVVRPEKGIAVDSSDLEKAEYAAGLIAVGALREAYSLLEECDSSFMLAKIYRSLGLIREYRFQEAVEDLKEVLDLQSVEPYRLLTAKINLVSCLIALDLLDEAERWIREVQKELETTDYHLLKTNLLELRAQFYFAQGNFSASENLLEDSSIHSSEGSKGHSVLIEKWRVLSRVYREKKDVTDSFARLRALAIEHQNWDVLREADFHEGLISRNPALLAKVYYGTPFLYYRNKLVQFSKDFFEVPAAFSYSADPEPAKTESQLDLFSCRYNDNRTCSLNRGQKLHIFLVKGLSDFYRPALNGAIFGDLYPGEFFDPQIAKNRIANLYIRIREFFKLELPDWQLVESDKSYRLTPGLQTSLTIDKHLLSYRYEGPDDFELSLFRERSGKEVFSKQDLRDHNGLRETQVKEVLSWGLTSNVLTKEKVEGKIQYSFSQSQTRS